MTNFCSMDLILRAYGDISLLIQNLIIVNNSSGPFNRDKSNPFSNKILMISSDILKLLVLFLFFNSKKKKY